jgi:hypothetical protein
MSTVRKKIKPLDVAYVDVVTAFEGLKESITVDTIDKLSNELQAFYTSFFKHGDMTNKDKFTRIADAIVQMKNTLKQMRGAIIRGNSAKVAAEKSTLELMLQALKTPLPPTHLPSTGGAKRKTRKARKTRKHKKVSRK